MRSSKIKLLLVSSVFVDRGAERAIIYLYNYLPKDIYEIKILCLRSHAPYANYLNKNTDIKVDVMGMKNNIDIFALYRFYQYLDAYKPDVINFHSFRAALWGRVLAKISRVPVILYSVHNKWGGVIHRFLDKRMSSLTDAIVPFSLAVKQFIINEEKIDNKYVEKPIYLGTEISKFCNVNKSDVQALRCELGIKDDQDIIGVVGSLSEQKGIIYLIESMRTLKSNFNNICCLIIGDGPDKEYLQGKVSEYQLNDHIKFLGHRRDIPVLLNSMKIFVLPSMWEGLPFAIIEAMSASCAVVATSVDGTPEIVRHMKNGWLVPPSDINELTNAIETLLSNDTLRSKLASEGFITAKTEFSIETMIKNYDTLYQSYLKKKS